MAAQPFDWAKYHELAQELVRQNGESQMRTAVSRAYYYIFHVARQRLLDNRFPIGRQNAHQQVWEKFSESPDHRCRKLAETAKRLKMKRETADYEAHYPRLAEDAAAMVSLAAEFAASLARLEANLPRNTGVLR